MKKSIVGLILVAFTSLAWALPSLPEVEAQVDKGNYTQAQSMMAEVVAAKPQSAKAHYLYAELLAHNASFSKAAEEAARAKALDPKIGFTDPAKFNAFEQTLQRELNPAPRARTSVERPISSNFTTAPAAESPARSPGIPGWVWLGGLVLLGIVLWRGFSRSRAEPVPAQAGFAQAGAPAGYGYGPGAGMNAGPAYGPGAVAPGGRAGSGLLGTGLAVAGGVAGGMLLEEMLSNRNHEGGAGNLGGANNIGGFNPDAYRPSDADQAASDLESRPIDFGNGGDWDSGGGSSDGGDSGGGGWD